MNHAPTQRPLLIPPSGYVSRHGDKWPTHRSKARRKRYNRRTAIRKAAS